MLRIVTLYPCHILEALNRPVDFLKEHMNLEAKPGSQEDSGEIGGKGMEMDLIKMYYMHE